MLPTKLNIGKLGAAMHVYFFLSRSPHEMPQKGRRLTRSAFIAICPVENKGGKTIFPNAKWSL